MRSHHIISQPAVMEEENDALQSRTSTLLCVPKRAVVAFFSEKRRLARRSSTNHKESNQGTTRINRKGNEESRKRPYDLSEL